MHCQRCNQENHIDALFCNHCGQQLQAPPPLPPNSNGVLNFIIAIVMGGFSGTLIYSMLTILMENPASNARFSTNAVVVMLLGSWVLSVCILLYKTSTTTGVIKKGFLLGAAEWLLMIGATLFAATRELAFSPVGDSSGASATGAVIGGGIAVFVGGAFCFFMMLICLAGYAITHFWARETRPDRG